MSRIEALGISDDPDIQNCLSMTDIELSNGLYAYRYLVELDEAITRIEVENKKKRLNESINFIPFNLKYYIGQGIYSNKQIYDDVNQLTRNLLLLGIIGSGKTNTIWNLLVQLLILGVQCHYIERKNEYKKVIRLLINKLNRYGIKILILPISKMPMNLLEPVGNPSVYYSMFFKQLVDISILIDTTGRRLTNFMLSIHEGCIKAGKSSISIIDLIILLEKKGREESRKENPWKTAARELYQCFNSFGDCAKIRSSDKNILNQYNLIIYDWSDLSPQQIHFLSGILYYRDRYQLNNNQIETGTLKRLFFNDEGLLSEYSREMGSLYGSMQFSPGKLRITQSRAAGDGIILGSQSIDNLDPIVSRSCASVFVMRLVDSYEAHLAACLLGNENLQNEIQTLPAGQGYWRSPTYSTPIRIQVPYFE